MAKTIKQKCNEIGIPLPTYYLRLKKGMTPEEALSTPNKRHQPKAEPAPLPISEPEDQEPRASLVESIGAGENHRQPLRYGPAVREEKKTLAPVKNWSEADEARFNNACGGYVATILNHTKDSEFKYQIYSTNTKKKLYTNDIVRFINQIIRICDPEGKTPFRVIER